MLDATAECFHCGEPFAGRTVLWTRLRNADVQVCCPGCRAAAQLIADLGLEDFYTFRTAPSSRPPDLTDEWLAYDTPAVADSLTRIVTGGRSIVLLIDGLTCAACSWLLTRVLQKIQGVERASVNTATGRAQIVWDEQQVPLSKLLRTIAELGYRANPVTADTTQAQLTDERHTLLKRLAVAGLGMMQVMMFAVAMYAGELQGMEIDIRAYLRLVSLLVCTPVMLYAGWPFFSGAAKALRMRSITMDVPVSLGLLLAYFSSVFNTWRQVGDVYFDSVTMFIFFLTVARYVEMIARHKSAGVTDSLSRLLPITAHRVVRDESGDLLADVAVSQLKVGDVLRVRAGEIVPADGDLLDVSTRIDESMLTGESLPVSRNPGDRLAAGTINVDAPFQLRVVAVGAATTLASIVALLNRAQSERPRITLAADRTASRFLAKVLVGAAVVCAMWIAVDPNRAFGATLAVLVVACPCALSLATLTAVASANAALARRGVLVTHADAIEALSKVSRVVFDKTGTLTTGAIRIVGCETLGALNQDQCLKIATALESASEHPIARAFAASGLAGDSATAVHVVIGEGVEGIVRGACYRIGRARFVATGFDADENYEAAILLGDASGPLAAFTMGDESRPESARAIAALGAQGLGIEILSGDAPASVARVAQHCGVDQYAARQSPADKLERVRTLTARGEFVAMVGDGINDAPVLGGSGVSIAMSRGSALTLASADLILVGDSLQALPQAFELARRAQRVIKQNLTWAAGYNLTAMPLAAMGWVPPWLAAIGMSLSSIFVVLNSMRLMREAPAQQKEHFA